MCAKVSTIYQKNPNNLGAVMLPALESEGVQKEPPQNVPPGHVDYFELKAVQNLQAQDKLMSLP